jgi:peptidoglycan glycosyltransferase
VPRPTPAGGLAGVGSSVQVGRGNRRPIGQNVARVGLAIAVAFGALAAGAGYWQVIEAAPLSSAPDNPAVVAAARRAVRGEIVDRNGAWLARNERDANGDPYRIYRNNVLSPVLGYSSRLFGSAGLERAFDAELVGLRRPDPVSDLLKKFERDPYDPQRLRLTLSLELQRQAVGALGEANGAVVILQPRTGDVLALASTPIYDANAVANPATSEAAFEQLRTAENQPLLARATQGRYVPGSVFKIVTALAALESGAVTVDTTFEAQPPAEETGLRVSGFRIRDGHHRVTGDRELDLVEATEVSCNIWYALAGIETGGEALADTADRLGFDGEVPFALRLADSQVTNATGQEPGGFRDVVELANAAYGQGETLVTPFQMALVAAAVANGGSLMEPRIVQSLTGKEGTRDVGTRTWRTVARAGTARAVQEAMVAAVEGDLGQQFTSGADVPGVTTAGKSGTAELGGEGEPHSWFIGFAPAEDPQVAIAVLVERSGRGAEVAAPIAGQMMEAALAELAGADGG